MRLLILTLVIIVCFCSTTSAQRKVNNIQDGFICLVPRSFTKNASNKVYLTLLGINSPGEVHISLVDNRTNKTIVDNDYDISEATSSIALSFFVPDIKEYGDYRFKICGTFDDDYEISGEVKVDLRNVSPVVTFIQTDKPFYKPGQEVMFRILPLGRDLRPLDKDTLADIWIQQPTGARVYQQKNVAVGDGIKQFEFPLANEPVMGMWTIYTNVSGIQDTQSFEVKEYVLPKFEVEIKVPPFVLATDVMVPISVCANYTYGKKVEGVLNLNISRQSYGWYERDKKPILKEKFPIQGCVEYVINVTSIDDECCRNIEINAQVIEKGTDVSKTASKNINRNQNPLTLSFETSSFDYVKPGLPFFGELKVTNPDETPAANEPINICMIVSREREISGWFATQKKKYCRNFTSTAEGKINYSISPRTVDITAISLEAKSLAYGTEDTSNIDYNKPRLYQPQGYGNLKSWYSPSGSHIQIQEINNAIPCGAKQDISVLYTCNEEKTFKMFYQVIGRNKVFKKKSVKVTCGKDNYVSNQYLPNDLSDNSEVVVTQLVPNPDDRSSLSSPDNKDRDCLQELDYLPNVGQKNITISVSSYLSPEFTLIVYYVREDREVVADSKQFKVDKCLDNKVTMDFGTDSAKPGESTSVSLTASPNSQCGIRVVDKSVILMDSSNPLTMDSVFNKINEYRSTYTLNHCSDDNREQPGLPASMSRYIFPPRPPNQIYSSSAYDDAYSAFEAAGFFVISDLLLLTRPCKTEVYDRPIGYGGGAMGRKSFKASAARAPAADMANDNEVSASLPASSEVTVRTYFPDTWLFEIQDIGENGELTTYRKLPDTMTEWVGDAVCIDQETGLGLSNTARVKGYKPFFLSLTLPYSIVRGEKLPVIVTVFNYLKQCLPISITLSESDDFILLSGSAQTEVCVCGDESKTHRFFVQPTIIGQLNFTVSGVGTSNSDICGDVDVSDSTATDALTNSIIVEAEGFKYEKTLSYFFFPEDEDNGVYTKSIPYELPEDYVKDSGRGFFSVTGDIMGPAIRNLRNLIQLPTGCGEQNIAKFLPNVYVLEYLSGTGELTNDIKDEAIKFLQQGYSSQMRYKRYDNSYSAFGNIDSEGSIFLTAFVARAFAEASPYISIDEKDLQKSIDWVISKQNKTDGCFPVIGETFSEGIKGGSMTTNATSSITAYILMSLLLANSSGKVYENAKGCIESENNPTPYQNSLFAYTFALGGDDEKASYYLDELYRTADETGDSTQWYYGSLPTRTEIAAYAVLTNIKLGKPIKDSLPIIRWMNSVRNSYGGFTSSQDTVTGLKALSKFAPFMNTDKVNLSISTSGILQKTFQIDRDDKLLLKTEKTSKVPGNVDVTASGSGGGLVQATVRCNTNKPYQEKYFELNVKPLENNVDCEYEDLNVCTRYVPSNKRSNMALLEIKMVSGVVPMKETLQKLQETPTLGIKRFDVADNTVVFYFDQLTNERTCFSFTVQRVVKVEGLKPATAKVYDYYAPEFKQEALYSLEECN